MGMPLKEIGASILGSCGFKDGGKAFQGNMEKLVGYRVFQNYQAA